MGTPCPSGWLCQDRTHCPCVHTPPLEGAQRAFGGAEEMVSLDFDTQRNGGRRPFECSFAEYKRGMDRLLAGGRGDVGRSALLRSDPDSGPPHCAKTAPWP